MCLYKKMWFHCFTKLEISLTICRIMCPNCPVEVPAALTSCRLCDKIADHNMKHYSQTVFMRQYTRSMLVQYDLPTDINIIRSCHHNMVTLQLTSVSLSCSLIIWSMTNLVFMWTLEWYLPPDEHLWVFTIPYEDHLPPCPPIAI